MKFNFYDKDIAEKITLEGKSLGREVVINDLLYEVGDKVSLPLQQEGIIIEKKDLLWGFNILVKITKSTFNDINDIVEVKPEQLELI